MSWKKKSLNTKNTRRSGDTRSGSRCVIPQVVAVTPMATPQSKRIIEGNQVGNSSWFLAVFWPRAAAPVTWLSKETTSDDEWATAAFSVGRSVLNRTQVRLKEKGPFF